MADIPLANTLPDLRQKAKGDIPPLRAWPACLLAVALLCLALPGRPVDSLSLYRHSGQAAQNGATWYALLPLGQAFTTVYEHSVERTPVEDLYFVSGTALYPWRTRTRSHNAGLPGIAPQHGRFLTEDSWLVLEGGHFPLESVRLRVGDVHLGRNELFINEDRRLELYTLFSGERVLLSPGRRPLLAVFFSTWDFLHMP